jgi:cytochrome b6-f complex iron-sulfur subunit
MKKRLVKTKICSPPVRRRFLRALWKVLGILAAVELLGMVLAFLWPRKKQGSENSFGGIFQAGAVESFTPDSVTAFRIGQFYLARLSDGGFLALSRKCTHLGCTVVWSAEKKQFVCPCHASVYDIRGDIVRSPAPRALDYFPVIIENDMVRVNTAGAIKRNRFLSSQAAKP